MLPDMTCANVKALLRCRLMSGGRLPRKVECASTAWEGIQAQFSTVLTEVTVRQMRYFSPCAAAQRWATESIWICLTLWHETYDSVTMSRPKANVSTVGLVDTNGAAREKIGIMKITAVAQSGDGQVFNFFPFHAAIDTGATRSLCSRELAIQLYGGFDDNGSKEFRTFSGDPVRYEVITRDLDLVKVDGEIISLRSVDFIDYNLPFSQYLPATEELPQRVDMIFGSEFVWEYLFSLTVGNRDLITLPLGIDNALEFDLGHFWRSSEVYHNRLVSNSMTNTLASIQTKLNKCQGLRRLPVSLHRPMSNTLPRYLNHLFLLPDVVPIGLLEVPLANLRVICLMHACSKDQIPGSPNRLIISTR